MDTESESIPKKRFNPNLVGIVIVAIAFVLSMVDVLRPDLEEGEIQVDSRDVVHFLHWQLEPGFREALDAVIADYNRLPHVREAGYRVQQMAVTERVYSQFLNVHLISGTAPDLAAAAMARMAHNTSQYFDPFVEVLEQPNPYNADAYLPEDMNARLREYLETSPWKETFIDGLQSGLDANTGYYFKIPIASWGTVRFYFNKALYAEVKDLLREAYAMESRPLWLSALLDTEPNTTGTAFLPDSSALAEWIASEDGPETFGQLVLICEACLRYAQLPGNEDIVPIGGSSYSRDTFMNTYNTPFFYAWEEMLDFDLDGMLNHRETFTGFDRGLWDFDHPRLRAYYDLQVKLASYFPVGFLGLDREQANRRFILGNSLFLASGAWDAPGIFTGASNRLREEDRFEVGILNFPIPARGERWGQFNPMPQSEASGMQGVPMALYKFSDNKEEAIDFLHYLTSYAANGKFVRLAGWLPTVIGIEPVDRMKPFLPNIEGAFSGLKIGFESGNVGTIYNGQYYLLISGDTDYESFVENVSAALNDERNGIYRQWYNNFTGNRESNRSIERSLSLQRFNQLVEGDLENEINRYHQVLLRSTRGMGGLMLKHQWRLHGYEKPFPEF